MTDWGLQGIYEVNMERLSVNAFLIGIRKPTGITQASLRYQKLCECIFFLVVTIILCFVVF